jgi:hemerythrin-like domain-containing protein
MRITDLLIAEHRLLRVMVQTLDKSLRSGVSDEALRAQSVMLAAVFADHAHVEADVLAPELGALSNDAGYFSGNMEVMDNVLVQLLHDASRPGADVRKLLGEVVRLAEPQFAEEEEDLFPVAEARMSEETLAALFHNAVRVEQVIHGDGMSG